MLEQRTNGRGNRLPAKSVGWPLGLRRLGLCAIALWGGVTAACGEDTGSANGAGGGYEPAIRCVHIDGDKVSDLRQRAGRAGLQIAGAEAIQADERASVVLWESTRAADTDDAQAARLWEYVRWMSRAVGMIG
jgi:hypothetical protein